MAQASSSPRPLQKQGGGSWSLISSYVLDNNDQTSLSTPIPSGYKAIKFMAFYTSVSTKAGSSTDDYFRINFNSTIQTYGRFKMSGLEMRSGENPSYHTYFNSSSTQTHSYLNMAIDSFNIIEFLMYKTFFRCSFFGYSTNATYVMTALQNITDPVTDLFTVFSSFEFYTVNSYSTSGYIEKGTSYYLEGLK